VLLKKRLAEIAVSIPDQRQWPIFDMSQHLIGNRRVVRSEMSLGYLRAG
jgi:hypothetical protein